MREADGGIDRPVGGEDALPELAVAETGGSAAAEASPATASPLALV
jgi:hypothetical protein